MDDSYPSFLTYCFWAIAGLLGLCAVASIFFGSLKDRTNGIFVFTFFAGIAFGVGYLTQGSRAQDNLHKANVEVALAQQALDDLDRETQAASSVRQMTFRDCQGAIRTMARDIGPPDVIAQTSLVETVRFSARDGSVLVTCSAQDQRMITTRSAR